MDRVHANLGDLETFRGLLVNAGATVQEIRRSLRTFLGQMSEDWKDTEYDRFVDVFLRTELALASFVESSETYSRHLQRLIQHLEEYLSTTLRSDTATSGAAIRISAECHRDFGRRDVEDAVGILGPIVPKLYSEWSSQTPAERLQRLQDLQSRLAASQSRDSVPLVSSRMGFSVFGVYDGQQIRINQDHLASPERFWQILDTLIHEDRHAYQRWALITPGFHADPGQVRAWAENWQSYLDPKEVSFRQYRSQPLENDAFGFAESVVLGIIGRNHV